MESDFKVEEEKKPKTTKNCSFREKEKKKMIFLLPVKLMSPPHNF